MITAVLVCRLELVCFSIDLGKAFLLSVSSFMQLLGFSRMKSCSIKMFAVGKLEV